MLTLHDLQMPVAEGRSEPVSRRFRLWLEDTLRRVRERLVPTAVKTSAYTARVWDLVLVNPSGGTFTVTLPSRAKSGDEVWVNKINNSANNVTIAPATGDTIDEFSTVGLGTGTFVSVIFVYDASRRNWSAFRCT